MESIKALTISCAEFRPVWSRSGFLFVLAPLDLRVKANNSCFGVRCYFSAVQRPGIKLPLIYSIPNQKNIPYSLCIAMHWKMLTMKWSCWDSLCVILSTLFRTLNGGMHVPVIYRRALIDPSTSSATVSRRKILVP